LNKAASSECLLCSGTLRLRYADPTLVYLGLKFTYRRCESCRSLICDPMPDINLLSRMYGNEYAAQWPLDTASNPSNEDWAIRQLAQRPRGVFLDYGCGRGALLSRASQLNWRALGVEFHEDVAQAVESSTSLAVFTPERIAHQGNAWCDVLHLGDVLEHCTNPAEHLGIALRLLKPGGILLAQGPLEANSSLFHVAIHSLRMFGRSRAVSMPPYHVILASARGQRLLFSRSGFRETQFDVEEVSWPAPPRLTLRDFDSPRSVALFFLRKTSQGVTWLGPSDWGNRYRYIGARP
jgi:SAM-dependent methyltransferase